MSDSIPSKELAFERDTNEKEEAVEGFCNKKAEEMEIVPFY